MVYEREWIAAVIVPVGFRYFSDEIFGLFSRCIQEVVREAVRRAEIGRQVRKVDHLKRVIEHFRVSLIRKEDLQAEGDVDPAFRRESNRLGLAPGPGAEFSELLDRRPGADLQIKALPALVADHVHVPNPRGEDSVDDVLAGFQDKMLTVVRVTEPDIDLAPAVPGILAL